MSVTRCRAHEVLQSRDDFRLVAERLAMLHGQVRYTIEERWAEVVKGAMLAFEIASTLATDPREGELAAHLATIRRDHGRRNAATGKRRKESKPE